jgi:hypothetical protein
MTMALLQHRHSKILLPSSQNNKILPSHIINTNAMEIVDHSLADALDIFRVALQEKKELCCPMDDAYLCRFLRARKFNIEEAVKLMEKYYEMKLRYDYMAHIRISDYKRVYDKKFHLVLRHRDPLGRKILYIRTKFWNPSEVTLDEIQMSTFFILHEMTAQEETQKNGLLLIVDHSGVTFSQATGIVSYWTLNQIHKMILFFQGSYPARFKGIHSINTPYLFEKAYSLFKYLLKKKIRSRILIHGVKALHKCLSADILPESLGGNLSEIEAEDVELMESLYKNEDYYHDHWKFGYRDGKHK